MYGWMIERKEGHKEEIFDFLKSTYIIKQANLFQSYQTLCSIKKNFNVA
jgi:hypothetical protein